MGLFPFFNRGAGKVIHAKVTTMDADLDRIVVEASWTGRHLFDAVCRIIGLREVWFFGLQFTNKKGLPCWLQMDREIRKQDVPREGDGCMQFLFLVKFYPEDVEEELIQDLTRHLFFLQIKQAILSMDLYCSPEASVLLASFAVQAINGDCTDDTGPLDLEKLLPKSVIDQYDMSADMWRERIKRWWINNHGQSREDAEMEYLRVAQDLEMYGILYYPICNKKETDLHLGISAQGLGIYKGSNRITPRPFFSWSEIKNISFYNKKFHMKTVDKSKISFRAQERTINPSILDLCIGTHNLYLRRRQPDTLEGVFLKPHIEGSTDESLSEEERARRQQEVARIAREREERLQIENERNQLKAEVEKIAEQLAQAKEAARKTEETAELLAEKARASEQETLMLTKRVSEAEAECHRLQMNHVKIWPMTNMALQGTLSHHQLMMSAGSQEGDRGAISDRPAMHTSQHPSSLSSMFRSVPPSIAQIVHAPPPDPSVNQRLEFHNLRTELEKSSDFLRPLFFLVILLGMIAKRAGGSVDKSPAVRKPKVAEASAPIIEPADLYKMEDEIARSTTHAELEKNFLRESAMLRAVLQKFIDGETEPCSSSVLLNIIQMRRCSRIAHYATAQLRSETSARLEQVEAKYLLLQNSSSEIQHLQKEISRCLQF
ncbi:FERM PH-like domain protein, partial [Ostertagia ostertagi]